MAGAVPNTRKNRGATRRPSRRSGSAPLVSVTFSAYEAEIASNARFATFQSSSRPGAIRLSFEVFDGFVSITLTSRSACGNGSGLISTVSTTENMVVVAAMPRVNVRTAATANDGRRASVRMAIIAAPSVFCESLSQPSAHARAELQLV